MYTIHNSTNAHLHTLRAEYHRLSAQYHEYMMKVAHLKAMVLILSTGKISSFEKGRISNYEREAADVYTKMLSIHRQILEIIIARDARHRKAQRSYVYDHGYPGFDYLKQVHRHPISSKVVHTSHNRGCPKGTNLSYVHGLGYLCFYPPNPASETSVR